MPEVCSLGYSHVEIARKEYKHLEDIWFSDVFKSQDECELDVLIEADYLWNFQTEKKNQERYIRGTSCYRNRIRMGFIRAAVPTG